MSDEHFLQHLNNRHVPLGDWGSLRDLRGGNQFRANRSVYETYHDWIHKEFEYEHGHG